MSEAALEREAAETQRQAAETRDGVETALLDAARLRDEGHQQTSNPVRWAATLAAARSALKRAEGVLASGVASDELRQQLQEARAATDEDEKDRRMVERLENLFVEMYTGYYGTIDHEQVDGQFARAFQEYGIAVDDLVPAEADQEGDP